ncbi:MAG: hypothetical protein ACH254_22085 [Candidatus Thiodiazotropha endolucinida]
MRTYPADIVSEASQKASAFTVNEALEYKSPENQNIIPFVCTYNPSLPNIDRIINQYWGLFKIQQVKVCVK